MAVIYPVILKVPDAERGLKGRAMVAFLSAYARRALSVSARKYGAPLPADWPAKDENGAPLPRDGLYWSISHKPEYVAGVVGPEPVGIDIERIRPFREGLQRKVATEQEWALCRDDRTHLLYRYWTAKEAVLKAVGAGLKGLSKCFITTIVDERHLLLGYQGRQWVVEHVYFDGHVAAVTPGNIKMEWIQRGGHSADLANHD